MSTRVFVPATTATLRRLLEAGRLAGPAEAHAVTDGLRAAWPDGEQEEWEYAAQAAAGAASLHALGDGDRPRRHVLAVDADEVAELGDDAEPTRVRVDGEIALRRVAAVHVDVDDLPAAAIEAYLAGGELPDEVGGVEIDHDLAWFARQELPHLL